MFNQHLGPGSFQRPRPGAGSSAGSSASAFYGVGAAPPPAPAVAAAASFRLAAYPPASRPHAPAALSIADLLRLNPCPTPDEGSAVASALDLIKLAVQATTGEISLNEAQYEIHLALTALVKKDDARKRLEQQLRQAEAVRDDLLGRALGRATTATNHGYDPSGKSGPSLRRPRDGSPSPPRAGRSGARTSSLSDSRPSMFYAPSPHRSSAEIRMPDLERPAPYVAVTVPPSSSTAVRNVRPSSSLRTVAGRSISTAHRAAPSGASDLFRSKAKVGSSSGVNQIDLASARTDRWNAPPGARASSSSRPALSHGASTAPLPSTSVAGPSSAQIPHLQPSFSQPGPTRALPETVEPTAGLLVSNRDPVRIDLSQTVLHKATVTAAQTEDPPALPPDERKLDRARSPVDPPVPPSQAANDADDDSAHPPAAPSDHPPSPDLPSRKRARIAVARPESEEPTLPSSPAPGEADADVIVLD